MSPDVRFKTVTDLDAHLDAGGNVDARDQYERTALHWIVFRRVDETVTALVDRLIAAGAD